MAFDPATCAIEEHTGLPVCPVPATDLALLHASIAQAVDYMAAHHIPRDQWDAPYVYREYLPDDVSGNDVVALSRVAFAADQRGIDLPPLMAPLLLGEDGPVTADAIYYVAENARILAELLGPLVSAMRAVDAAAARRFPWGWIAAVAGGAVLLGVALTAPSRKRARGA